MEGRLQRDDGGIMEGRLQKEPVHQCPLELWQSCAASAHATLPAAFGYVALAVNYRVNLSPQVQFTPPENQRVARDDCVL
jgi:hypothetical protein